MTAHSKIDLSLALTIDLLIRAKDSLQTCLEYETQQKQYALSSLLLHAMHCIDEALMKFDKEYYDKKECLRRNAEAARRLALRGG